MAIRKGGLLFVIMTIASLTLYSCRARREAIRSAVAEDSRIAFHSLAQFESFRLDSTTKFTDFEADSITMVFRNPVSSGGTTSGVGEVEKTIGVTIHNPRVSSRQRSVATESVREVIADSLSGVKVRDESRIAQSRVEQSGSGVGRTILAVVATGLILAIIVGRRRRD